MTSGGGGGGGGGQLQIGLNTSRAELSRVSVVATSRRALKPSRLDDELIQNRLN